MFTKSANFILSEIPQAYFIMVGDGNLKSEVENYSKKHGFNDCLLITGWINNHLDYVNLFDVAVLPSRWGRFWFSSSGVQVIIQTLGFDTR